MRGNVLYDFSDPALRRFNGSHLDTGKGFIELLGNRSHLVHSAWEADFLSMVHDLAHRGNDSGCSAKSALGKVLKLSQFNRSLSHLKAQIVLCHIDQGTPGDGWEDGIGLGGNHLIVLGDKQEVGSACLFHTGSGGGIQEYILIISCRMGCHRGLQTHGIVQPGLYMACSLGSGTVKIADTQGQWFGAALKIGANRGSEQAELVLVRGFNTDHRA